METTGECIVEGDITYNVVTVEKPYAHGVHVYMSVTGLIDDLRYLDEPPAFTLKADSVLWHARDEQGRATISEGSLDVLKDSIEGHFAGIEADPYYSY